MKFLKDLFQKKIKVIVILGQTGVGKTDLSIDMAHSYCGEIISADSRQIYTGLNLGSGKITPEEMRSIPHHMLDVVEPSQVYSVFEYQQSAKKALQEIAEKKKTPIVCGGTGMYIDALIFDHRFPQIPANEVLRDTLEKLSTDDLVERLRELDTAWLNNIDTHNRPRLIRAIEIIESGGSRPELSKKSPYNVLFIGLQRDKDLLHARIHKRIINRLNKGMIDEVRQLLESGKLPYERAQSLGLEYRYISQYIKGKISREEMIEILYAETKKFAKRQKTWFKRNKKIHWFHPNQQTEIFNLVGKFLKK